MAEKKTAEPGTDLPEAGPKKLPESGQVVVACKLPNGLILRVFKMEEYDEPVMGGGIRRATRAIRVGDEVKVHGFAINRGAADPPEHRIVGGYGLTEGVDAQFFAEWQKQNADSDLVRKGLIFAFERSNSAADKAKENRDVKSGLEPLKPDTDARIPKGIKSADKKEAA